MNRWRRIASVEGQGLFGGRGDVRVLEHGGAGVLLEVRFGAGVYSAVHRHAHDSYLYLLTGRLSGTVGGEPVEVRAGASLIHRAGIDHSVVAVVDSRWLESKTSAPAPAEDLDSFIHLEA